MRADHLNPGQSFLLLLFAADGTGAGGVACGYAVALLDMLPSHRLALPPYEFDKPRLSGPDCLLIVSTFTGAWSVPPRTTVASVPTHSFSFQREQ
jgi:hypothetical protein